MRYCVNCGKALVEGAAFCSSCGASVTAKSPDPVPVNDVELNEREHAFLENTHRLLRWERKAWSIAAKVFIITGIVFAALFMLFALIGIIFIIDGDSFGGGMLTGIGFMYAIIFGVMFIALGIVSKKAEEKLPQYIETVYTDFSLSYNRCGNIGMLIFSVLLGVVSPVFFIINFVRMKSNRAAIERIIRKQKALR